MPPNRRTIYTRTRTKGKWDKEDIMQHETEIISLFESKKILLRKVRFIEGSILYRANSHL